ncbi:MAG: TRAP transporter small permease [Betaproteobacteria bacterium]|nr:TRAP transporter small permease [Betaproteobacteria bacterium]
MVKQSNRALDLLAEWMALVGGFVVFLLMLMVAIDAIGRKVASSLPGALEFSEALMIPAVFLPLMFVQLKREHVFVGVVTMGLSVRTQSLIDAVAALIGVVLFGFLTWLAMEKAIQSTVVWEYRIAVIPVPIWPFRWIIPLGTGLMVLQLVLTAKQEFKRAFGVAEPLPHDAPPPA